MSQFEQAIPIILLHEGGFVNHPSDPGGATNFGVSLRYLKDAGLDIDGDGDIDSDDIRKLNAESASVIYRKYWWDKYGYERIHDQYVATKVFDMAVNMGAKQAHILLQRACNEVTGNENLTVDGILGAQSLAVINSIEPQRLIWALRNHMANFYRTLARNKPQLAPFLRGWLNRAAA